MKVVTVLNSKSWITPKGGRADFRREHAQWLHKQIKQHWDGEAVCLSDKPIPDVETIPLRHNWEGWWSKLEMMRPDIEGDILYMDLDTVLVGDITPLAKIGKTTVLRDFYKGGQSIGSGLMYITEADRKRAWDIFTRDPNRHIARCVTRECWGDQGFLQPIFKEAQRWQDVLPEMVVSFKASGRVKPSKECRVACFHGNPRPWHAGKTWIPKL